MNHPNPSTTEATGPLKRGAIWCDPEHIAIIRKAASLRGQSMREYMADLAAVAHQHAAEAARQLLAVGDTDTDNTDG
tara:strand:- start:5527 stop:5757 length:231 start_codon:yes stop_codon:yes gene_type:complete